MSDYFSLLDEWGPEKTVVVSDPDIGMQGVLVIDNTARGIGKGGTRMTPTVDVPEVARLARVMTWKWAAVDLFYGGAKAGIRFDPTSADKEKVLRSFVRKLRNEVPDEYVFGLDMGLTEVDAAIINDELGRGAAVGTPYELGGIPYDQLGITGHGVAEVVDEIAARQNLKGASVAVQGFGAVGHSAAKRLHELGYRVTAVSSVKGALANPDGLNIPALLQERAELGDDFVYNHPRLVIDPGQELFTPADILVPAALQNVISERNVADIKAKLVVEAANLPTNAGAQTAMREKGITVVPDFIANAGGVVSAAFAMESRFSPFRVDPTTILDTVATKLRANAITTLDEAQRHGETTHQAARRLAQERVRAAMNLRGHRVPPLSTV
jgi:glutamate dehydrogenase (NAD(P)+)